MKKASYTIRNKQTTKLDRKKQIDKQSLAGNKINKQIKLDRKIKVRQDITHTKQGRN